MYRYNYNSDNNNDKDNADADENCDDDNSELLKKLSFKQEITKMNLEKPILSKDQLFAQMGH